LLGLWLIHSTQPQQKRLADDVERRVNALFDALNCETLSRPVCDQLLVLTKGDGERFLPCIRMLISSQIAMEARDRDAAASIHMDLLTRGSQTDDIGLWMFGVKQLIMRL
jgi:protein transport protein SEC31